ncbi:hypothetical protein THUN1654_14170 [Rodentibacter abscessus]
MERNNFFQNSRKKMKELKTNDLSLVVGGNPILKTGITVADYIATREVIAHL